jgi:hypothetical protein
MNGIESRENRYTVTQSVSSVRKFHFHQSVTVCNNESTGIYGALPYVMIGSEG